MSKKIRRFVFLQGIVKPKYPNLAKAHQEGNQLGIKYLLLLYGKVNPRVLIGSFLVRISPYGPFPWKRSSAVYFLFSKASKFKTSMAQVPYNKLLTNLARSSYTGEYWPSVVFPWTSLCLVHTATTSGQYSQYGPRTRLVRG